MAAKLGRKQAFPYPHHQGEHMARLPIHRRQGQGRRGSQAFRRITLAFTSGPAPLCCPGGAGPTLPSATAMERAGPSLLLLCPWSRSPGYCKGQGSGRAPPPHLSHFTADKWQSPLSCVLHLRAGSPASPTPRQLYCATQGNLLSRVLQLGRDGAPTSPDEGGPVLP